MNREKKIREQYSVQHDKDVVYDDIAATVATHYGDYNNINNDKRIPEVADYYRIEICSQTLLSKPVLSE